jgi:hypothetical protein
MEQSSILYNHEIIEKFVEEIHFSSTHPNDIPKKVLKALLGNGTSIVTDTLPLKNRTPYNILICFGENNRNDKGYLIVKSYYRNIPENRCILYLIKNNSISFTYYRTPETCDNWNCIKPYLIHNNYILRIGGDTK